jgi:hypothetical protein
MNKYLTTNYYYQTILNGVIKYLNANKVYK